MSNTGGSGRIRKKFSTRNGDVSFAEAADRGLYGDEDGDYVNEIVDPEPEPDDNDNGDRTNLVEQYTVSREFADEAAAAADDHNELLDRQKKRTIAERESQYQSRKFERFRHMDETEEQRIKRIELEREESRVHREIQRREQAGEQAQDLNGDKTPPPPNSDKTPPPRERKRRRRWDVGPEESTEEPSPAVVDLREQDEPPQRPSRWDNESQPQEQKEAQPVRQAISDKVLDQLLPQMGYEVLEPPEWYKPSRKAADTNGDGFAILEDNSMKGMAVTSNIPNELPGVGELQYFKESDMKHFSKLLDVKAEENMSAEVAKERKIMRLLLKIKNGTPQVRKVAMRSMTDNARIFGAKALIGQIIPLITEPDLEDQERHLLVKVIDRILFKLGDTVRPYTYKLLVVTAPLLTDTDHYAKREGEEIISNLAKAVGLKQMITTLRPDIDAEEQYVRDATARSLAVVAKALGIEAVVPFVAAVCRSKRSALARHTGAKTVQWIAYQMGSSVLPKLTDLVEALTPSLRDSDMNIRTVAANACASLAEVCAPYGIESFDTALPYIWKGAREHRGRPLAAFLRCIGYLMPLMEPAYATTYANKVFELLKRHLTTQDEDMRRVVLKVLQQCVETNGLEPPFIRREVLPQFFRNFWTVRNTRDVKTYRAIVDTTVILSRAVGSSAIIERLVDALKHEAPTFRKMALEAVDKVVAEVGLVDSSSRLEERLIDALLIAMQLQDETAVDYPLLNCFGTVVNALGPRAKPYLDHIASAVFYRLSNPSEAVREQAAELVSRTAIVMKTCGADALMGKIGSVLYEQLGEEYPGTLGSILGALKSIVMVVGLSSMQPPIRDLLPRLTPILKNRHEKVQENAIDLVGCIADRGAEMIAPKEWMRICHELLEMLRAHRKSIRRAANNTFGYIANAIGPQDVLAALLTGLKVQERQLRVCIAVAIGIVAETCLPFTVLPAVMNEYRVPEKNVQNGVLKSLTFMFEYIGPMAKDYVYAIAPLLEDALMDRDQVHRQTAATVVKHIALGTIGLGLEDVMIHFLNMLLPNIFETSPHVINRIIDGVDGVRNAVGPGVVLGYTWAGLFQAARKVRTPYWKIYNNAYVQQADAMVPYYPDLKEPQYKRHELDIWI